ncbi:hypothetical protein PN499_15045 [Kamptonema animale CS-326]|uniref:hypothetical protein n=1 Tax=Kamptonema animale TaxID=92934 RepID=UPI0023306EEB|nr:hypothetical protein [Kamptonema animale]MDB9512506.1 hypothetical protein [Kamptonema animale CS-326]
MVGKTWSRRWRSQFGCGEDFRVKLRSPGYSKRSDRVELELGTGKTHLKVIDKKVD